MRARNTCRCIEPVFREVELASEARALVAGQRDTNLAAGLESGVLVAILCSAAVAQEAFLINIEVGINRV